MHTSHTSSLVLLLILVLATLGEAYGVQGPREVPNDILASKKVCVYLQSPSSSRGDTEYLSLANHWVKDFFARPEIAPRLTLVDDCEKADIVLFAMRGLLNVSTVGIPSGASTVTLPDGSVVGSRCYDRSDGSLDCDTYEGRLDGKWGWELSAYRARDFGKNYSILPPEADPDPVPNPLASPLVVIDERQVRVEICVHGYTAPFARQFELAIGCEVLEFWNRLQRAENKPQIASTDVLGPGEQIIPNSPMPTKETKKQ
jgi:hypothetical protein